MKGALSAQQIRGHLKSGGALLRRNFADNDLLVINPDTLVALPDQPVRQD
jgi:hypothetical protein